MVKLSQCKLHKKRKCFNKTLLGSSAEQPLRKCKYHRDNRLMLTSDYDGNILCLLQNNLDASLNHSKSFDQNIQSQKCVYLTSLQVS